MIIQHVIKGIPDLTRSDAQRILAEGIHCNWVRNYPPLKWDEIAVRLTADNLDWHQNRYTDKDPNFTPGERFYRHTGFISTTAGTYLRDIPNYTNICKPAWQVALKYATAEWRKDGYLFYCYLFVLGRKSVSIPAFSEELRELNVYTDYSDFQAEGEIAAKISIPPAQIEKAEFWSLADAKAADLAKVRGTPGYTLTNSLYQPPDDINNVRKSLD
jgi:hypothetical protein